MFLKEGKTGNSDYLGIDTKGLGMNKRKRENISCSLPKLKSTMYQRTYHISEKKTHKIVIFFSNHMPSKGLLANL